MHVNFAIDKKFEFSLKGLKERYKAFTLTKLNMLVIAFCILAFMILFGAFQKLRLDSIQSDVTKLNREAMALKKEAKTSVVGVKNVSKGEIFTRFDQRVNWAGVLKEITESIPKNVYLRSVRSIKDRDNNKTIEIKGEASDQTGVVDLTTALGRMKAFVGVKVQSSESVQRADTSALNFTVLCNLKK